MARDDGADRKAISSRRAAARAVYDNQKHMGFANCQVATASTRNNWSWPGAQGLDLLMLGYRT
jgi:hypothetical protein